MIGRDSTAELRLSLQVGNAFAKEVPVGDVTMLEEPFMPGGTNAGINNCVMDRNKSLEGKNANNFRSERWLDTEKPKFLRGFEFAFAHGARV